MEKEKRFTKTEKSWIMYDWANSIYATNIMAAIFPIYFALVATDTGDKVYGFAVSAANLVVAVLAPLLGAIGDFTGMKKKLFSGFLVIGLIFTATMAFTDNWKLMLVGFVLSRIGFSGSCLFYDSFLTDVTTPERMDKVSSWGYAMGYIGGSTIPFVISIVIMVLMGMSTLSYKIAILIVVVWWSVFSIPFLRNVKQVYSVEEAPSALAKAAFSNAIRTFKDILRDKKILFFILAYFFYIDGVDTIISLATNYGTTLELGTIGMILALLVTQIVAVPFSILFGNLSKKVGAVNMISVAVGVYFVITIIGFFMGFNIEQAQLNGGDVEAAKRLSSVLFWVLAGLVGTVQGGIQALSRSYFGQIIPPERSNEYYGFLDIFGKFSCVIGPALYSLVYSLTDRSSLGILSIILLFFAGGIALLRGRKYFKTSAPGDGGEN
ncbi:MAG: MFS transporter [Oscillospiraceae bacterium]|nr:MFS transporter [Oscillospiraceae bacterium]